jgi:phasin family protein
MPAAARNIREQNVASIASARDGAQQAAEMTRQAAAATQETIRTAVESAARTFQDSAEQIGQALGVSRQQGEEFAQQSSRNLEAVTQCNAILARGFQEISREWLSLAQHRFQRNLEGLQALASCRTAQEIVAAQTDLVREHIQEVVENGRRIAEVSMNVANEAAQTFNGSTGRSRD